MVDSISVYGVLSAYACIPAGTVTGAGLECDTNLLSITRLINLKPYFLKNRCFVSVISGSSAEHTL